MYKLFWGDLHSHCGVSYGHGTAKQALARARQQLDFCSLTGHAFWPDMPSDRSTYADAIDYHREGFARLATCWDELLQQHARATEPASFIALPSYEWHSSCFGDHNVYVPADDLPLRGAADLPALRDIVRPLGGILIPHHIGYAAGYRGINWREFREDCSPFVEIFSLHGCSLSGDAPYPMLHVMGPRDHDSMAEAGWAMGHRFGIVGGTDHHSAYPGSHGDGRMGVFATSLTREALWEGFLARRVFAATGDRIDARLFVNDAWIGSSIQAAGKRDLRVSVCGADALDKVELLKNGRVIRRFFPEPVDPGSDIQTYRLRITWGWGCTTEMVQWNAMLTVSEGAIRNVETCFSGQPVVAPKGDNDSRSLEEEDVPHALLDCGQRSCVWRSMTTGNLSTRHATTQALSLEIEAPLSAVLTIEVNNQVYSHPLVELLRAGRSHFLKGLASEAIQIGPLIPETDCVVEARFTDEPTQDVDVYRLQVAQHNGQWAWLSPLWAER